MLILWSIFNFVNIFFIMRYIHQNGYVQHISASIKILADEIKEDEKKKKILRITVSEYQNLRGVHLTTLPKIIFLNIYIKKENKKNVYYKKLFFRACVFSNVFHFYFFFTTQHLHRNF